MSLIKLNCLLSLEKNSKKLTYCLVVGIKNIFDDYFQVISFPFKILKKLILIYFFKFII